MKSILLSFILSFSFTIAVGQTIISGKVVRVADGDTFTLLDNKNKQVRIRLYGIDCPENKQDFSQVAKKFTSDRVFGKVVKVEVQNVDRYGRIVGLVVLPDGKFLNEELLKAGLAWHYTYYDKTEKFAKLERIAKRNKVGLWRHKKPIPPWDFRKLARK
jgi:endonuclease YncB( thermonuclease family)